jgi:hypothetical protein
MEFDRGTSKMKQGHELTKLYGRVGAQTAILFLHTGDADETWVYQVILKSR